MLELMFVVRPTYSEISYCSNSTVTCNPCFSLYPVSGGGL